MQKFNYRFVLSSIGLVLLIEAVFMLFSAFVGEYYHEATVESIYISSIITSLSGAVFILLGSKRKKRADNISKREVYITVTVVWLMLALYGTFPYILSGAIPSFVNAYFESMCGLDRKSVV